MKKLVFFAGLLCAGIAFTACESNDSDFNPSTESEAVQTVTFEGSYWNELIDAPQYYGSLLYGPDAKNYYWCDEATQLCGYMSNAWGGAYGFSEGGSAISNYIDENTDEPRSFDIQLAVPVKNGSNNFVVVFCNAGMKFADNKARVIKSMDIIGTTYFLSVAKNGDGNNYAKALTSVGDFCNVEITGYKDQQVTGTLEVALAKDGGFLDKWYTTDMTTLGAVDSLSFTMNGCDQGAYGLNTPAYFAIDNVVVKK